LFEALGLGELRSNEEWRDVARAQPIARELVRLVTESGDGRVSAPSFDDYRFCGVDVVVRGLRMFLQRAKRASLSAEVWWAAGQLCDDAGLVNEAKHARREARRAARRGESSG